MIELEKNYGRIEINIQCLFAGNDICILITGGDKAHIGAISIYSKEEGIQTISLKEHKDFYISELCINNIKDIVKGNISVSCGIHVDNISKDEIEVVYKISKDIFEALKTILEELK